MYIYNVYYIINVINNGCPRREKTFEERFSPSDRKWTIYNVGDGEGWVEGRKGVARTIDNFKLRRRRVSDFDNSSPRRHGRCTQRAYTRKFVLHRISKIFWISAIGRTYTTPSCWPITVCVNIYSASRISYVLWTLIKRIRKIIYVLKFIIRK